MAGLIRRALQAAAVCLTISVIAFLLLHAAGDPVHLLLPMDASANEISRFRRELALDQPLVWQYRTYLVNLLRGDFGQSLFMGASAIALVGQRIPLTVELAVAGIVVAAAIAVPLGLMAATHRGGFCDLAATSLAVGGQAVPNFLLGLALIVMFSVKWGVLPGSGAGTWRHLVLPATCLGLYLAPLNMRLIRTSVIDALEQDYIRTAHAKGLSGARVLLVHAFRNALVPVVTVLGLQFGRVLGGAIVVETVFAWPGLASLTVSAIQQFDYPVVQAAVLSMAVSIVAVNLLTDLLLVAIDPRLRRGS